MSVALLLFAQLTVTVAAPDTVRACEPFSVSVVGSVRGVSVPRFTPPRVAPFSIVSSRASAQTSSDVTGRSWSITDVELTLLTDRPGRYTLPRFEMRSGSLRTRGAPRTIVVLGDADSSGVPAVVARADIDTSTDVALRAIATPDTVYVGEQATYQVGVFISPTARDKLRSNPSFVPPQLNELMAYDYSADRGRRPIRRRVGSQCYDVLVYERALFPLVAGRHSLAPAQLSYSLAVGAGFFAGSERREARSDSISVVAIEPPEDGRPAGYAGAVGDLAVQARLDTGGARVGDPLVLTLRVAGEGNVKLLPRPPVSLTWASLVTGDERVTIDTLSRRIRGSKEFDWIVTPTTQGQQTLPPISYPFWNPRERRYELAATSPETLFIGAGALVAAAGDSQRAARRTMPLAIRRVMRAPVGPPPPQQPIFAALALLAPIPALSVLTVRRRRRAPRAVSAAGRLRAVVRRGDAAGPAAIRVALVAALVERKVVTPFDLGRESDVVRALRRCGVSSATASEVASLLAELDAASYASTRATPANAAKRALTAFRAVDAESRDRAVLGTPPLIALVAGSLALASAAAMSAAPLDDAERLFASGVRAYDAGRYAVAAASFDSAATAHPRAADAWANAGTAHWIARDTAQAVVGWQKALRLDPLDGEVRTRLDLTPGPARGVFASVPAVPTPLLALAALALWWAAWLVAAFRLLGRSTRARGPGAAWVYALHGIVAAAVVAYVLLDERLEAKSLAVIADPTQLRAIPSLAGDAGSATRLGAVVRVIQREGRWSHVAGAAGEEGWIESDRLLPLRRG
ncbi:MAG TPA: hypothetical protein VHM30_18335 [Gemmatimonadaceae bacterium]|nr:hypothetical protein [Gemmatimonadaceae bacterium]